MTHTLHRRGSKESLSRDYVVAIFNTPGFDPKVAGSKMHQFLDIATKHNPVNVGNHSARTQGNVHTKGVTLKTIYADPYPTPIATFDNKEAVINVLRELKEADLGCSVIVSGVIDEVFDAAKEVGITPHSLNVSLGIWGKTELLPEETVVQINTMCGHCYVTPSLIENVVSQVRTGRTSMKEAIRRLAAQCWCGSFNPSRAAELLKKLV
ncbi:MAG: hypothetical protein ACE5Z5_00080 [Candidatus Bathyarchaeia archaeon]